MCLYVQMFKMSLLKCTTFNTSKGSKNVSAPLGLLGLTHAQMETFLHDKIGPFLIKNMP